MTLVYDPLVAPAAAEWLALSEDEKLRLVMEYHAEHAGLVDERRARAHAALDSAVETQIAQALPAPVAAVERLTSGGLSRLEAVHAIGYMLLQTMSDMLQRQQPFDVEEYARHLGVLTAAGWRKLVQDGATGSASS